jgi:hypothetical protein
MKGHYFQSLTHAARTILCQHSLWAGQDFFIWHFTKYIYRWIKKNSNMRLGQLARKLALRPSEISDFLLSNNITIEEGSNAKIQDEHVVLIMQKYAPSLLEEMKRELIAERESEIVKPQVDEIESAPPALVEESLPFTVVKEVVTAETSIALEEPAAEKNEVIKAPKIALSGLKVIGKIDLPELKKKETPPADNETPSTTNSAPPARKIENRKENSQKRDRPYQQPRKNPIALQRERELAEIEQKKKIEEERRKEQRTRNYLKKVKSAPTKPMKIIDEQVEEMRENTSTPPKTWIGKFFRWLRS